MHFLSDHRTAAVVIFIIIISMLTLGIFSFREMTKNDIVFEHNQDCAKYIPAIEQVWKEHGYNSYNPRVLKMFYSHTRKSCLYEWQIDSYVEGDGNNVKVGAFAVETGAFTSYALTDELSNELLEQTPAMKINDPELPIIKQSFFDSAQQYY
jgi:hypothetical protein